MKIKEMSQVRKGGDTYFDMKISIPDTVRQFIFDTC